MPELSSHHRKGETDLLDVRMGEKADARSNLVARRRNHRENIPGRHSPLVGGFGNPTIEVYVDLAYAENRVEGLI